MGTNAVTEMHFSIEETVVSPHLTSHLPSHANHHSLTYQQHQQIHQQDLHELVNSLRIWIDKKLDTTKLPATWPPFPLDLIVDIKDRLAEHIKADEEEFTEMKQLLSPEIRYP